VILKDINIEVNEGELVSIVGPSGSGKSTIFNIITNLIKFDSGEKRVNGDVSYMYQKDMMVPWKKVVDNIATPLVFRGMDKKNARKEVEKYIDTFGLTGFQNKYPNKLSGGMKQRANFLQTYLTSNDIMLLDEPFGALDSITRSNMQQWLLDIKKNKKFDYKDVKFLYTPNIPSDDLATAQMLNQTPDGIISKDTARGLFSFINNKVTEGKKVDEENQEEMKSIHDLEHGDE
ncbi:MAG: ATP-binding cassette domain-containing protein, partial [Clostridium sp.]|nr:ATP-binding cassette domain-containing protein [Clostridium sp.]